MRLDPHSNYSSDWVTPPEWKEWVKSVIGDYFDPCPEDWSKDGLTTSWESPVYCNPPGTNGFISIKQWWEKAMQESPAKLMWCFFNCEHSRHISPSPWVLPGYMVIPQKRIAFWRNGELVKSPRNWSWFWSNAPIVISPPVQSYLVPTGRHLDFQKLPWE